MMNFYWSLFATSGSIDAYLEYKNLCDHNAFNKARGGCYNAEAHDENFSRQWYCSEDYSSRGIE